MQAKALEKALVSVLGVPFIEGNAIRVLRNGDEIFPAMLAAIESATGSVDFLTHVYWSGDIAQRFADALAAASCRGVKVRVLLDGFGCRPMEKAHVDRWRKAGAIVSWFRPFSRVKPWKWDSRTHRKILICDQRVGFTGGVGIAHQWCGDARNPEEWRETHFQLSGPALQGLSSGFLSNWSEAAEDDDFLPHGDFSIAPAGSARIQVVRSSSSFNWSDIAAAFRLLISQAQKTLDITTAYFVPDERTTQQLCDAAKRGVRVRILLPGKHTDSRLSQIGGQQQFGRLVDAGVALYLYQRTMLHAKILVADSTVALVGSANMNHRSMSKDEELCLAIIDKGTVDTLNAHFNEDMGHAEALDPRRWRDRSLTARMAESFLQQFRGQL